MGHSGNRCDLASTLCKYDLRKGDLFVLSWASLECSFPIIFYHHWLYSVSMSGV